MTTDFDSILNPGLPRVKMDGSAFAATNRPDPRPGCAPQAPDVHVEPGTLDTAAGRLREIAGDFRTTGLKGVTALEPVTKALGGFDLAKAVDAAHTAWHDRTIAVADTLAGRAGNLNSAATTWRDTEGSVCTTFGG
ncbi:WXG100 family type VII secretion target [Embleya sp. NPDC056575]|uniref:WXG100 family type VII secretion target n=1 Tax=unclassified Embleya TaxID=2699296 RepID=UPI0036935607